MYKTTITEGGNSTLSPWRENTRNNTELFALTIKQNEIWVKGHITFAERVCVDIELLIEDFVQNEIMHAEALLLFW